MSRKSAPAASRPARTVLGRKLARCARTVERRTARSTARLAQARKRGRAADVTAYRSHLATLAQLRREVSRATRTVERATARGNVATLNTMTNVVGTLEMLVSVL